MCDSRSRFRTVDGVCNNLIKPLLGSADTPFKRFLQPAYDDGISTPRSIGFSQTKLPNVRTVSLTVSPPDPKTVPEPINSIVTLVVAFFGQFVKHDFAGAATFEDKTGVELECGCDDQKEICSLAVEIPQGDQFTNMTCMMFTRSVTTRRNIACEKQVHFEQINIMSSFLDGSQIYGRTEKEARMVRAFDRGLLATSSSEGLTTRTYLPLDPVDRCSADNRQCFLAGEFRTTENLGLTNIHMLFNREHNRIAKELSMFHPNYDDEKLFQETRNIVIALYQHIIYNEWLPLVLGDDALKPMTSGFYEEYDPSVNIQISNELTTTAMRFGHTLIRDQFMAILPSNMPSVPLKFADIIENADLAYNRLNDGLNGIMVGEYTETALNRGIFSNVLQNELFIEIDELTGLSNHIDLFATNLNRARDHGIPSYADVVRFCQGPKIKLDKWITNRIPKDRLQQLDSVYKNPEDYDLFAAGIAEKKVKGGVVGPTFACLIKKQFTELRDGDRFYYENDGLQAFTKDQLDSIRGTSFAGMVCNNFDIDNIQQNPFLIPKKSKTVDCSTITQLDLNQWKGKKRCKFDK